MSYNQVLLIFQNFVLEKEDQGSLANLNMSLSNMWDLYKKTDFSLNITGFINENIGVFVSVSISSSTAI